MQKAQFAVLLYALTAFLTFFFIVQQLAVPLPGLSVHLWPVALGVLFTLGAWMLPEHESPAETGTATRKQRILFRTPGRHQLRMVSVYALLLMPFICWLYAPVRYSGAAWEYLCLMSMGAVFFMAWAAMCFACCLREVARRFSTPIAARLAGVNVTVLLYVTVVPLLAVLFCKTLVDGILLGRISFTSYVLSMSSTMLTSGSIPRYLAMSAAVTTAFSAMTATVIFCGFRASAPAVQVPPTSEDCPAEKDS
ncbi:MAG: hypothetical protein J6S21_05625 [Victivallales bacterium]|nr:hypothetical protein [Victivallales bacterium]